MHLVAQVGARTRIVLRGAVGVAALARDISDLWRITFLGPFPGESHLVTIARCDADIGFTGVLTRTIRIHQTFDAGLVGFDAKGQGATAGRSCGFAGMIGAAGFGPITKEAIVTVCIGATNPAAIAGVITNRRRFRTRRATGLANQVSAAHFFTVTEKVIDAIRIYQAFAAALRVLVTDGVEGATGRHAAFAQEVVVTKLLSVTIKRIATIGIVPAFTAHITLFITKRLFLVAGQRA
jgi:hypothetical protein